MIAIDWGTSAFRACQMDTAGVVLERRSAAAGLLACNGAFQATLVKNLEGWDDPTVLMAGMIGSRNGWREVPYVPCPAGIDEIAAGTGCAIARVARR
jgi:2-dehydro-3-deoxygalactonokinase